MADSHVLPDGSQSHHADQAEIQAAIEEQNRLRHLVETSSIRNIEEVRTVAGVDISYDDSTGTCSAAAVVLDMGSLEEIESEVATKRIDFPYIPGLLAFRELPALLCVLEKLSCTPDVIFCDGYGVAHPRRIGLASHLGVLGDVATVGVAKNPLTYSWDPPGQQRGCWSPMRDGSETVGRALRTRQNVKPVFVSVGHKVGLDDACTMTMGVSPSYRIPEPIRRADKLSRSALGER